MNILIERFMDLEVRDCMKVIDIFNRMSKQFDELEAFYRWCKVTGLARSSEYPEVDRIEQKKLDMMDEVVRDKMALAQGKRVNKNIGLKTEGKSIEDKVPRATNGIRASPPPKEYPEEKKEETKQDGIEKQNSTKEETHKLDPRDNEVKNEEQTNKLALALIDISTPRTTENATPEWVAFTSEDTQNWETSFVHSSSTSDNQQAKPGGGFNGLPLEAVYQQSNSMTLREAWGATGSASSVALGSTGKQQAMLALPAPPVSGTGVPLGASDPFSASWSVSPPAYVQMSEIEQKQRMLVDEQLLWQQYARDGSRGHMGVQQYQNGMGAYSRMY
ncbi:hypothetical protein IFM89_001658 [Coptis chinensis]|uniref:AP180 N-terminal homology (ANTH) domain-containing protein n=1 Tax=Coptis chinensis TaxID=261450 RepID=A0A835HJZ9_9MAGN|nr:hypothetical protein IFM89_001658 [Coptis chinensis]